MTKKLICVLFAALILFSSAACTARDDDETQGNDSEEGKETPETITFDYTATNGSEYERVIAISVPASWKDKYEYEGVLRDDGGLMIDFYDKAAKQEGFGGLLFALWFLPPDVDYTYLPSYTPLGSVVIGDTDTYNVLAYYPSDVQFDPSKGTEQSYNAMSADISSVLSTLTFSSDAVFTRK